MLQWGESCPEETYRRLEGSLAFCDLSGFTAMSEKLASLGRLGAEELTDVLNLLFAALLDDAAVFGGGLLKYGGDAVLLFFEGDAHAARAAAATHRMRATLRRLGRVTTSRGTVRVRMSVGIHTGDFDFFLVGESHRELIVTGVAATTTCDMETAADAGEIMLSPATAAALPASCVGDPKGDGFLLRRAPRTPPRDPSFWGVVPDEDPLPFIPVGLRRHVGEVGTDAEHRHVAVGFIAFGGVDELLAHRGGEHTAQVLHDFIASCQAAFDHYEVCFLYADIYGNGGKVFFTSGAPVSHEDNEERLLRAALDINATAYPGLHLHTGLNRGYVFAGDVGATFRRTYTIIGDAVNTAARVMASCDEDGQIRTMPAVLDLATSRFETAAQTPFAAKGKALPLETFAVGKPLGPRRPDAPLPLIGRDKEFASLRERLRSACIGSGGFVRVVGETGVGKSRLVEELRAAAESDGVATLVTYGERYERDNPYYAIHELLKAVCGNLEQAAEAFASALSEASAFDSDAMPYVFGRNLVGVVDSVLDGPALWIIDNAHLLDRGSVDVLSTLDDALVERPWLLVFVGRSDDESGVPLVNATELELHPLDSVAGTELARAARPELLPTQARLLAERAGGSPLLIRQLEANRLDDIAPSDSVEAAVAARIDRLPLQSREVLRTAAVLGGRFELDDLYSLTGDEAVDIASLGDFLAVDGGTAVFRQAVYRDVAYGGLTFKRRRALHQAAGELLELRASAASGRLSFHFHSAQDWEASWKHSIAAADSALELAAKIVAASLFARAIEAGLHIRSSLDRAALVGAFKDQSLALFFAGETDQAGDVVARGLRLASDTPLQRAGLRRNGVAIRERLGDTAGAIRWARLGLNELENARMELTSSEAAEVAVPLLIMRAKGELDRGRIEQAKAFARRARDVSEFGSPELQGRVHTLDLLIAFALGDLSAALVAAEKSVDAHRLDGRFGGSTAVALANLASLKHMAGQWAEAERLNRESLALNEVVGNDVQAATSEANLAEVLIDQGRFSEAEALLDRAAPVLAGQYAEGEEFVAQLRARLENRRDGVADNPDDPLPEVVVEIAARLGPGRELGDDEDAKRLGIVAVPEWAKPVAT